MKIKEVNKIIAEYMGFKTCHCCDDGWDGISRSIHNECIKCGKEHIMLKFNYHRDLNKLISVWRKLGVDYFDLEMYAEESICCIIKHKEDGPPNHEISGVGSSKTPQEAAALATAKVILHYESIRRN